MPFTPSHPALVLPLTYLPQRLYSLTGLVIGSMTPDFEYFIRMRTQSNYSHTILGLLWFDLPLGLLLGFIFHNIVRDSLFNNFPTGLKSRFAIFNGFDWNKYFRTNWFVVIISILIGAGSHLLWDSFTHSHGYFVENIPSLSNKIAIATHQIPIYNILQHSSTLIGGLVIAISLYKLPSDINVTGPASYKYWIMLTGLTLTIIAIRLLFGLDYRQYGRLIVTCISAVLISLVIIPLIAKIKNNW
jgi:Domain of unknown function (DUF4184)